MSPYGLLFCVLLPFANSYEFVGMSTISNIIHGIESILNINILNGKERIPEDGYLNVTGLGRKYGYNVETHAVVTEDGYILKLHRIPSKTNNSSVVFLMHGILDSSESWLLQGPDNALGYILADQGFDVWMGNARGNKYSQTHKELTPEDTEYWNFTWEEIGLYDLPASIDYISNRTGQDVYYIGYSQGTTNFFVMESLKEYNKVKMMYALSPIAWMKHTKSPILRLLNSELIRLLLPMFNTASSTDYVNTLSAVLCDFIPSSCDNVLRMFIGSDNKFINSTLLPIILKHFPTESSILQIVHYFQLMDSGHFRAYDYGFVDNMLKYGRSTPPDYNISNIKTPVSLFYSNNDWLSDISDVATLYRKLPNVRDTYYVDGFNHFDYVYASTAKYTIYEAIVNDIRKFENGTQP